MRRDNRDIETARRNQKVTIRDTTSLRGEGDILKAKWCLEVPAISKNITLAAAVSRQEVPQKKAPVSSEKKNKAKLSQPVISPEDTDSDTELTMSQTSTQEPLVPSSILKQFGKILHKALKQTSDQITSNLTVTVWPVGPRRVWGTPVSALPMTLVSRVIQCPLGAWDD